MSLKIVNRVFKEIYSDDEVDWPLANTGDWCRLVISVEAGVDMATAIDNIVKIDKVQNAFVLLSAETWASYGFRADDVITLKYRQGLDGNGDGIYGYTPKTAQYTVIDSNSDTLLVQETIDLGEFETLPKNYGRDSIVDAVFFVDKPIQGVEIQTALIENALVNNPSAVNVFDGTSSTFNLPQLSNLGDKSPMVATGLRSGAAFVEAFVTRLGKLVSSAYVYAYEIELYYQMPVLFDTSTDFTTNRYPDFYIGGEALTVHSEIAFFPQWNDPNAKVSNKLRSVATVGNTGYIGENYNNLPVKAVVDSITYTDEFGAQTDGLSHTNPIQVRAVIGGVNNLGAQSKFGFGFCWKPNDLSAIKEISTPYHQNVFDNSNRVALLADTLYPQTFFGSGNGGARMDVSAVKFSIEGSKVVMTATFSPTAEFKALFEARSDDDRNYVLWASVADSTLDRAHSDRVPLKLDFNSMVTVEKPATRYDDINSIFVGLPFEKETEGVPLIDAIVQDRLVVRMPFLIKKEARFESIGFGFQAYNPVTKEIFTLEKFPIDLSGYPVQDDTQQISFLQSRGFKMPQGHDRNEVSISRDGDNDTVDKNAYVAFFATAIRWEDWLENPNAPDDFYDAAQANNGKHHDWIKYARKAGWVVSYFTEIFESLDGEQNRYVNRWNINIADYNENPLVAKAHRLFVDETDESLDAGLDAETGEPVGIMLKGDDLRYEVDFEILDGGVWDITKVYGEITVEPDKGGGRPITWRIDSLTPPQQNNPLQPLSGEQVLHLETDGPNKILTLKTLIKQEFLDPADRYRLTARQGCKLASAGGTSFTMALELQNANSQTVPDGSIVTEGEDYRLALTVTNTGSVPISDTAYIPLPVETIVDGGDGAEVNRVLEYLVNLQAGESITFTSLIHFETNSESDVINHTATMAVQDSNTTTHVIAGTVGQGEITLDKAQFDSNENELQDVDTALAEDVIEYVITIDRLNGTGNLSGTDVLDSNLEFIGNGRFAADALSHNAGVVSFTHEVTAGTPEQISFYVKIAQGTADGTTIPNSAEINFGGTNFTSNSVVLVINEDISPVDDFITMVKGGEESDGSATTGVFTVGETFRYTFDFTNVSGGALNGVVIQDLLPDGVSFISGTQTGGTGSVDSFNLVTGTPDRVDITVTLADGETALGYLLCQVDTDATVGTKTNQYTYSTDQSNIYPINVVALQDVTQTKQIVDPDTGAFIPSTQPLNAGQQVAMLITAFNTEALPRNVVLSDVMRAGEYDYDSNYGVAPSWALNANIDPAYDSPSRTVSKAVVIAPSTGTPTFQQLLFKVIVATTATAGQIVQNTSTGTE